VPQILRPYQKQKQVGMQNGAVPFEWKFESIMVHAVMDHYKNANLGSYTTDSCARNMYIHVYIIEVYTHIFLWSVMRQCLSQ
jgi:hypothetical protein